MIRLSLTSALLKKVVYKQILEEDKNTFIEWLSRNLFLAEIATKQKVYTKTTLPNVFELILIKVLSKFV